MKKIIVANWKMYLSPREAGELAVKLAGLSPTLDNAVVIVCPSFMSFLETGVALSSVKGQVHLGAQNCFWENRGAYTGEISPVDLKAGGAEYVIIGHSERRRYAGETDAMVNQKVKAALAGGLTPIVCIGETAEEKRKGQTEEVVKRQLQLDLLGITLTAKQNLIAAYEPVWAIGTGNSCDPHEASHIQQLIKKDLSAILSRDDLAVLYGGSVDDKNVSQYLSQPAVDGVLVGGASAQWEKFYNLLKQV